LTLLTELLNTPFSACITMKKLIINALLVFGFVAITVALFVGLNSLRAVDEVGAAVDAYDYEEAYAEEVAIQEESGVTVTVVDNVEETDVNSAEEESDSDVDAFLNSLG
jgi:hypothetical protein